MCVNVGLRKQCRNKKHISLYPSEFILILLSVLISSLNTSKPVQQTGIRAHAMSFPPPVKEYVLPYGVINYSFPLPYYLFAVILSWWSDVVDAKWTDSYAVLFYSLRALKALYQQYDMNWIVSIEQKDVVLFDRNESYQISK